MNFASIFFYVVSAVAVVSALLMVTRRNPIMSVLFLIVNFFSIALLYLMLHAQFIAIIQILIYAGAIMVLFVFVIMLLNLGDEEHLSERVSLRKTIAIVFAGGVVVELIAGMGLASMKGPERMAPNALEQGTVESIGRVLFRNFLFPFEVTSLLLLVAVVGVIVLAKKKFK